PACAALGRELVLPLEHDPLEGHIAWAAARDGDHSRELSYRRELYPQSACAEARTCRWFVARRMWGLARVAKLALFQCERARGARLRGHDDPRHRGFGRGLYRGRAPFRYASGGRI